MAALRPCSPYLPYTPRTPWATSPSANSRGCSASARRNRIQLPRQRRRPDGRAACRGIAARGNEDLQGRGTAPRRGTLIAVKERPSIKKLHAHRQQGHQDRGPREVGCATSVSPRARPSTRPRWTRWTASSPTSTTPRRVRRKGGRPGHRHAERPGEHRDTTIVEGKRSRIQQINVFGNAWFPRTSCASSSSSGRRTGSPGTGRTTGVHSASSCPAKIESLKSFYLDRGYTIRRRDLAGRHRAGQGRHLHHAERA